MAKGKRFPPEFRAEAVRLYRMSGRSRVAVARELGISNKTLGNWVRQADIDDGKTAGLTTEEKKELTYLRRRVKLGGRERDPA